jgi:ppGpp synthetase/RelA/SpoT-type nucleotidyltranferase
MKWFKLLIFITLLNQSCAAQSQKINGVSFVASPKAVSQTHIEPIVRIHANYCAIMPFGFMRHINNPEVIYNTQRQWFGETKAGAKQYITELRKENIKIMLKPQIWVWHGEFTGYIDMQNEAEWNTFEASYSKFILEYAQLAKDLNVDIFCIGTELGTFVEKRPEYWKTVIAKIKKIYKGKLTYAANWDEFKRTPFWNVLDFIGVDAYFPVSDSKTPTVEACLKGWQPHKAILKNLSETNNTPVLFTEFGYRSADFTAKTPWESDRRQGEVNLEAQVNATQALFETFWNENWFAGGFIWKWFIDHNKVGGENNNMFTPQNKPVETVIQSHYEEH